jgi:cytochrome c biogenesis protein CcmG, thiol:disulfide interchange protein DsbE
MQKHACGTLERMRRALPLVAAVALAVVVVVGLTQAGGGNEGSSGGSPQQGAQTFSLERARAQLRGAPQPLASLYDQANELLRGGKPAFQQRIKGLRGHPVVINKWASWCGPCRAEFPIFQSVATERGREVAFVGLDARDKRPAAAAFLTQFPIPYPSYEDPAEDIARSLHAPSNFPITLLVDDKGKTVFMHQGGYRSKADLTADLDRWLAR